MGLPPLPSVQQALTRAWDEGRIGRCGPGGFAEGVDELEADKHLVKEDGIRLDLQVRTRTMDHGTVKSFPDFDSLRAPMVAPDPRSGASPSVSYRFFFAPLAGFEGFEGFAPSFFAIWRALLPVSALLLAASFAISLFNVARSLLRAATCFSSFLVLASWLFRKLPTSFESVCAPSSLLRAATCFSSFLVLASWLFRKLRHPSRETRCVPVPF